MSKLEWIPKTIHRIWLNERDGTDDVMPGEFEQYGDKWAHLHPDWEVITWRDREGLPKLQNQRTFDRAQEFAPKDWKRFEADLLRLELLWLFGGVYVDCDVEPLKPFDPLLDGNSAFIAFSPNRAGNKRVLTQAVMAAAPGHRFLRHCIDELPDAARRYAGRSLAQQIGPYHVDRVYRRYANSMRAAGEPVTVFNAEVFYPQSNRDRDAGRKPDLSKSFAHHRWANTRDNRHGGVK